jgi:hypothetical protein
MRGIKISVAGLLIAILSTLFSCRSRGGGQNEMFSGKNEKSAWHGLRFKKKRDAYNPYLRGKKEKPSTVQAKQDKKDLKNAKREVRREKRRLRRTKGAYKK